MRCETAKSSKAFKASSLLLASFSCTTNPCSGSCSCSRQGQARPRAHWQDGAALLNARKDKAKKYPELLRSHRCRLVIAGMEVGGRWDEAAYDFLVDLAKGKAEEAPKLLWGSAANGWLRQWVSMLFKAGMDSFAN